MNYTYEQAIRTIAQLQYGQKVLNMLDENYISGMVHMVSNVFNANIYQIRKDIENKVAEYMAEAK